MNPFQPVGKAFLGFLEATGKLALFTFVSASILILIFNYIITELFLTL